MEVHDITHTTHGIHRSTDVQDLFSEDDDGLSHSPSYYRFTSSIHMTEGTGIISSVKRHYVALSIIKSLAETVVKVIGCFPNADTLQRLLIIGQGGETLRIKHYQNPRATPGFNNNVRLRTTGSTQINRAFRTSCTRR